MVSVSDLSGFIGVGEREQPSSQERYGTADNGKQRKIAIRKNHAEFFSIVRRRDWGGKDWWEVM